MKDKIKLFALVALGALASVILLYGAIEYLLPPLLPFIIAWAVASVTVPLGRRLAYRIGISPRIGGLVCSLSLALVFILIGGFALWKGSMALWSFLVDVGEENGLYNIISSLLSGESSFLGDLFSDELADRIGTAVDSAVSSLISAVASFTGGLVGAVPRFFLFLVVTIVSLGYFSLDYDRILSFAASVLPDGVMRVASSVRRSLVSVVGRYILSYSIIMLITYAVLLIGFLALDVPHGPILALLVAFLDILPIIGVGTVLVPWSIYELALGTPVRGIGLILLFVVNAVIRQIAEPRIVGRSLNMHPAVTIIMLYVGYALFGLGGMLLLPIIAVSISSMLKSNNSTEVT